MVISKYQKWPKLDKLAPINDKFWVPYRYHQLLSFWHPSRDLWFRNNVGFFLQFITFGFRPRRKKKRDFGGKLEFGSLGKKRILKKWQNPYTVPKLWLLLIVSTIIGTSSSFGLFRICHLSAKWAVLSYELLKFGCNLI